jgi:hypothetical protein
MRIDPTGELAEKAVHAYSVTCCNDSPSDPSKHWITKIFPNVKRAPGKDAILCTEKVTDSVNSKHKLYDAFYKRGSTCMLQHGNESESRAVDAYMKNSDCKIPREIARQQMLQNREYRRCIHNSSVTSAEIVTRANKWKRVVPTKRSLHAQ